VTATHGRPVSIAFVGYSFIGLLRAGNFQFDYKLPERHPTSTLLRRTFPLFLVLFSSSSVSSCFSAAIPVPLFLARGPMKNSPSFDRDGIIGRPTLFMAFIFLEIADSRSAIFLFLSFTSFSRLFFISLITCLFRA